MFMIRSTFVIITKKKKKKKTKHLELNWVRTCNFDFHLSKATVTLTFDHCPHHVFDACKHK